MSDRKRKPSDDEQNAYYWLRSNVTAALQRERAAILDASPAVREAVERLEAFTRFHDQKEFRIFRPEDSQSTHTAGDRLHMR